MEEIDAILLKAYAITSKEIDRKIFIEKFVNREEKVLANQVFIEKFTLSKAKFINSNAESKNKELVLSNSLKFKRLRTQPSN